MISITQKGQNKNVGFPTFLYCLFPTLLFYPLQSGHACKNKDCLTCQLPDLSGGNLNIKLLK